MQPVLSLSDTTEPDALKVIGQGLDRFNDAITGVADRLPLNVLVRDVDGAVIGGIIGRSSLGLMFLDLVYLPEELRGQDIGSRMLAMAEAEGARRGCQAGVLYTISFQAPGFYERHGWRRFGEIPCAPQGTSRIFMTKLLKS